MCKSTSDLLLFNRATLHSKSSVGVCGDLSLPHAAGFQLGLGLIKSGRYFKGQVVRLQNLKSLIKPKKHPDCL